MRRLRQQRGINVVAILGVLALITILAIGLKIYGKKREAQRQEQAVKAAQQRAEQERLAEAKRAAEIEAYEARLAESDRLMAEERAMQARQTDHARRSVLSKEINADIERINGSLRKWNAAVGQSAKTAPELSALIEQAAAAREELATIVPHQCLIATRRDLLSSMADMLRAMNSTLHARDSISRMLAKQDVIGASSRFTFATMNTWDCDKALAPAKEPARAADQ